MNLHKKIISKSAVSFELSYSSFQKKELNSLINLWNQKTGILIPKNKLRVRLIQKTKYPKRNKYGSLIIKENKKLVQIVYNRLLKTLFSEIFETRKENVALEFILGCFEGDGAVNAKKRAHISLFSNSSEYKILEKIIQVSNLKFKTYKESENKITIRFPSLDLLYNLLRIKDKIFQYYPKKRQIFIKRFLKTGSVNFIMGKQSSTSGWIKKYLKEKNILGDNYSLTSFGLKIKKGLFDLEKEIIIK